MPIASITRRTFGLSIGVIGLLLAIGRPAMSQPDIRPPGQKPLKVSFESGNGSVVAHLHLPSRYDPTWRYPAVAIGGSMSSVKEQMADTYAGELAQRGIIALAIDYRNFGESSGAKRQCEDPASKAEDLSAALRFLKIRPDVSGTGLLGICTSGGTVLYTAATDANVRAVATVAGYFADPEFTLKMFGPEGVEQRRASGREALKRFDKTGVIDTVRAYDPVDKTAASTSPSEYYMDTSRGGGVRSWRNEFALMGWEGWLDFNPVAQATAVTAPALIIHSDGSAFPDQARRVHELLGGPKHLHWTEGKHFDFYDRPETVRASVEHLASFFIKTLK